MPNSLRPHGLQPTRHLHPWDFLGNGTGMGCHYFHLFLAAEFGGNCKLSFLSVFGGLHHLAQRKLESEVTSGSGRASQMVLVVENPPANAGDVRDVCLTPGLGRSPGGGHFNPLQCSCLENPVDRGAWRATVHRVAKSRTQLK